MTTNDGTPMSATNEPCRTPITAPATSAARDRDQPRVVVARARQLQLGDDDAGDAADVADREVDLADQEHEDDADRDHGRPGHLHDQVVEVDRGEEDRWSSR